MKKPTLKVFLTAIALIGLTVVCGLRFSINPSHAQTGDGTQAETTASNCPKCKGAMEPGIVRDYWNSNSFDQTAFWPGHQRAHIFTRGTNFKITVYRCANCGYLESYAK